MNEYDVKRLALVFAIQAEIEGMKVENTDRKLQGHTGAYSDVDFFHKASELENLANKNNDQL